MTGNTMHGELEDLIARHFDGHLDVDGERRLAVMLAASAEARQTFARYLRLEGAALRLTSAPQLDLPSVEASIDAPTRQTPPADLRPVVSPSNKSRSRWVRITWLAIAASLLAALIVGQRLFQPQPVNQVANSTAVGEIDRLAEVWLQLQNSPPIDEPAPAESAPPAASLAASEGASETELDNAEFSGPELEADSNAPPAWMIAAMADLAIDKSNPDEK